MYPLDVFRASLCYRFSSLRVAFALPRLEWLANELRSVGLRAQLPVVWPFAALSAVFDGRRTNSGLAVF